MVKNSPCKAEDTGSISGLGTKPPRAAGQLSARITATEVCVLRAPVSQLLSPMPRLESVRSTKGSHMTKQKIPDATAKIDAAK